MGWRITGEGPKIRDLAGGFLFCFSCRSSSCYIYLRYFLFVFFLSFLCMPKGLIHNFHSPPPPSGFYLVYMQVFFVGEGTFSNMCFVDLRKRLRCCYFLYPEQRGQQPGREWERGLHFFGCFAGKDPNLSSMQVTGRPSCPDRGWFTRDQ